jgi:hypothetical protein
MGTNLFLGDYFTVIDTSDLYECWLHLNPSPDFQIAALRLVIP